MSITRCRRLQSISPRIRYAPTACAVRLVPAWRFRTRMAQFYHANPTPCQLVRRAARIFIRPTRRDTNTGYGWRCSRELAKIGRQKNPTRSTAYVRKARPSRDTNAFHHFGRVFGEPCVQNQIRIINFGVGIHTQFQLRPRKMFTRETNDLIDRLAHVGKTKQIVQDAHRIK